MEIWKKKNASFKDVWDVWKYADWYVISLEFVSPFLKTSLIFASLKIDGNSEWKIELWKLKWRKSMKVSAFSLTILDGISESLQAIDASRF